MFKFAAELKTKPTYGQGGRAVVHVGALNTNIGTMRSWMHKAARRSTERDMRELLTTMAAQVAAGFYTTATDYLGGTVVFEDIGIAAIDIIPLVEQLRLKARRLAATALPLGAQKVDELMRIHAHLASIVARAPRCRIVAEMASVCLLSMKAEQLAAPGDPVAQLKARIDACRALPPGTMSYAGPEIRATISALVRARIHECNVWSMLMTYAPKDAPLLTSIQNISKTPGTSQNLALHLAVWVVCLGKEGVRGPPPAPFRAQLVYLPEPWNVPDYAHDKHTRAMGTDGYLKFYTEGILCDSSKRVHVVEDEQLRKESLTLRTQYELVHGPNSSRSALVMARLAGNKNKMNKKRKVRDDEEEEEEEGEEEEEHKVHKVPEIKEKREVELKDAPICQQITGTAKCFVHAYPDYVLKGPYTPECARLLRTHKAAKLLREIDHARQLPDSVLPGPESVVIGSSIYLKWPNVGKLPTDQEFPLVENKIMKAAHVIPRHVLVERLSDLPRESLTPTLIVQALNIFYARYVAEVADTGAHNILVQGDHLWSIDFEEVRHSFDANNVDVMRVLVPKPFAHCDLYAAQLPHMTRLSKTDAHTLLDAEGVKRWERMEHLFRQSIGVHHVK